MTALAGTTPLVRFALRRDRIMLPSWIYLLIALIVGTAYSFRSLYSTTASRLIFGTGIAHNPALLAMVGPMFDPSSVGGLTAWRIGSLGAVLLGLMSSLTVVRHTRAEEESGRMELLRAGRVGRHSALTAALITAAVPNLVVAVVVSLGLIWLGLPAVGSFALGGALAGTGLMFAMVGAVSAQLTTTARAANGVAGTILGLAFTLRAFGDASAGGRLSWLSWLSPVGWGQRVRPFAGERWWVFGLMVGFVILAGTLAYVLAGRRDFGAGLVSARAGADGAGWSLSGPFGLAWRLHRAALIGWFVMFVLAGAAIGGVTKDVASLVNGSSRQLESIVAALGGRNGITDAYLAAMMSIFSLIASAYAIQAVLRMRAEETSQHLEPILAARVGRIRWVASHLTFALSGTAIMLAGCGTAAGLTAGVRDGDIGEMVPKLLVAALVQLPAVWVIVGIAIMLFGLLPRYSALGWTFLVVFLLLGQLGPFLRLPAWMMDVSPFTHVPKLPGGTMALMPLVQLVVVATGFVAAGLTGFRQRDVGS